MDHRVDLICTVCCKVMILPLDLSVDWRQCSVYRHTAAVHGADIKTLAVTLSAKPLSGGFNRKSIYPFVIVAESLYIDLSQWQNQAR